MTNPPENSYRPEKPEQSKQAIPPALPPRQPYIPPAGTVPKSGHNPVPVKTNGLAITSLVLGILGSFIPFSSLAAIITGHIALRRTHKGLGDGRGLALTGTILGYVFTIFITLAVAAAIALPVFLNMQINNVKETIQTDVKTNVSQIENGTIPLDEPEKILNTENGNLITIQTDGINYAVFGQNESIETYAYWYNSVDGTYGEQDNTKLD